MSKISMDNLIVLQFSILDEAEVIGVKDAIRLVPELSVDLDNGEYSVYSSKVKIGASLPGGYRANIIGVYDRSNFEHLTRMVEKWREIKNRIEKTDRSY